MEVKTFIDIAPRKELNVCGNCKHLMIWGVSTGMCMNRKKPTDKMLSQSCKKFERNETHDNTTSK